MSPRVGTAEAKRRRWGWWYEPELLVCGIRGHFAPAVKAGHLPPDWADLEATTTDGRRFARCLRCDAWILAPPELAKGVLAKLEHDDLPRRGRPLRDAIILRVIAVERGIHAVLFGLAAIGLVILRLDLAGLQASARQLTDNAKGGFAGPGQTASQGTIVRELERLLNLRRGTLGLLAVAAVVYCVVEGTEAVGLWLERRWAEYLTAVATAGFLPFEVHELVKRTSAFRVGALIVNLLVLAYLVWRKHLFGVGGKLVEEDRVAVLRDGR